MESIEKSMMELLEQSKKDRKVLNLLKVASVTAKNFELAVKLRDIETANFPDSKSISKKKQRAIDIQNVLKYVDIEVPLDVCWTLDKCIKDYDRLKGNFSLRDASKIIAEKDNIFNP
jgi:hypothetical protein